MTEKEKCPTSGQTDTGIKKNDIDRIEDTTIPDKKQTPNASLSAIRKEIEAANQAATINTPTSRQSNQDDKTAHLLELLRQSIIDPANPIDKPQVCLWLKGKKNPTVIATMGNFSMVIGKAKSRKTFLIVIALAAATRNNQVLNFIGTLPDNQNRVLYFDTEQGKYHAYKTVKRICQLADIEIPQNLTGYGLRKFQPSDRLAMIETAIYNTPGLGFVVIDGIRDLVSSINDEEQATMISSCLLRWTEELNIHIVVILHQNKTDQNARGHLGTELQNKAETVLSVTKDLKNKEFSIVEAEYCRDKEPEPFAFEIFEGLPFITEDWEIKTSKTGNSKKVTPDGIPLETHIKVLKEIFIIEPKPLASVLYSNLTIQFKKLFDLDVKRNKAVEFVTFYKTEGILSVNDTNKTKDKFHILNDIQPVMDEYDPF